MEKRATVSTPTPYTLHPTTLIADRLKISHASIDNPALT
jgi:hypothetical protein